MSIESMVIISFNSRPHKEVDINIRRGIPEIGTFNSRPHKEVDEQRSRAFQAGNTFNSRPHKEVDLSAISCARIPLLSIHDLTRRSTYQQYPAHASHSFQFTTSQGGRLYRSCGGVERERFQFTTSQGGRLVLFNNSEILIIFQFTTSQGGRQ